MRFFMSLTKVTRTMLAIAVAAQLVGTNTAMADSLPCTLNSPAPGESPSGLPSVVFSPVEFDGFEAPSETIAFFEGYSGPRSMVIFNLQAYDPEQPPDPIELRFLAAGKVVHSCTVRTVDPARNPREWAYGNCAIDVISGPEVLRPGVIQVIRLPQPVMEASTFPRFNDASLDILDHTMITTRVMALVGLRPGPAVLIGLHDTDDKSFGVSICPFLVGETELGIPPDDKDLCRDPEGAPLRLKPGQRAEIAADGFAPGEVTDLQAQFLNADVAEVVGGGGEASVMVEAKAPGMTSILLRSFEVKTGVSCIVVVK